MRLVPDAVLLSLLFANFTGIGLGVAGIAQKKHKKNLSIIGLVLNIAIFLSFLFIRIFGI